MVEENEGIVLGVIPARGGSRRVPKKNIKPLGGKPLVAWTIEAASKAETLDYFLISTDDPEIAKVGRDWTAKAYAAGGKLGHVPFKRPAKISEDIDSAFVCNHALQWFERKKKKRVGFVCTLQPTSPFRQASDIDCCVELAKIANAETVISVAKAKQNPYWMFSLNQFNQQLYPGSDANLVGDNLVSQKLPLFFYPNGAVYVTRRDLILENRIFGDQIYGYKMPAERSFDLEEHLDFVICSALIPYIEKGGPFLQTSWIRD